MISHVPSAQLLPWSFSPLSCLPTCGSGSFEALASTAKAFSPPGFLNLLALSSAPCLPALFHAGSTFGVLPSKALLLQCSRTSSPTPYLPSCRSRHPSFCSVSHQPSDCSASCEPGLRLFECPSPSGLCSTSKSATSSRLLGQTRAHGSSGLYVLRGVLSPRHARAFTQSPLSSFLISTASDLHLTPQGFRYRRDWLGPFPSLPTSLNFSAF